MLENNNSTINDILKKYLAPTIIVLLEVSSISFFNTLIVGKMLGKVALAVMSLTASFSFLYYMFGCLINIGAVIAASVALGKNETEKVGKYERFAFLASVIIPIAFSIIILIFMRPVMTFLGADAEMYELSKGYVLITLALGFVYTLMYFPFNFLRLDGRSKIATGVFAIMMVGDFVAVFIVLKLGLGLTAVGLAAMLTALLADVIGVLILCYGKGTQIKMVKLKASEIVPMTKEVFKYGSSSGLNNFWNMLRTMFINKLVAATLGTDGLAVFAVACSIINLTNATTLGIGQTAAPLIGVLYGERDNRGIKMMLNSGAKVSLIVHTIIFALLCIFAPQVSGAFGIPDALLKESSFVVRWTAAGLITSGIVNTYINAFSALKHVVLSNVLAFLRSFGLVTALSALLLLTPVPKIYIASFMIADILTMGVIYLTSVAERKKDANCVGILMLDKRMEEGDFISFSVSAEKDSGALAAEKVSEFLEEKDISPKLAMGIPLAIEELISVMSEHCFDNDPSRFSDVRIFENGDDVIIRIRCAGKVFDPMTWYKKRKETLSVEELLEDPSLGIKLINDMAKEVSFSRTFGVNNLIAVL